jgi:hypothetical protein
MWRLAVIVAESGFLLSILSIMPGPLALHIRQCAQIVGYFSPDTPEFASFDAHLGPHKRIRGRARSGEGSCLFLRVFVPSLFNPGLPVPEAILLAPAAGSLHT